MVSVDVALPTDLPGALRIAADELPREIRVASAIHWYQQGRISMERAAETAGLTRGGFLAELASRRIDVFTLDDADLRDPAG
jgi:predicted HTH domain antitoxin